MKEILASIMIGHTTVVNGYAVTRWSAASFEVGTWGKSTVDIEGALAILKG